MEIEYLKREEINIEKWDNIVGQNSQISHSNYSWFLDIICKNWGAYKVKDQEIYFPLPFLKGLKSKLLFQPIFSRELCVVSEESTNPKDFISELILRIQKDFKHFHFNSDFDFDIDIDIEGYSKSRKYQKIVAIESYNELVSSYSTNAKRQIKKYAKEEVEVVVNSNISEAVELMKQILGSKVNELKGEEFQRMEALIKKSIQSGNGYLISFWKDSKIETAGFFILKNHTLIFLKGAAKDTALKNGAMYYLLDFAFQKFGSEINEIDFDGSNIEGVAEFYRKLGGKDFTYFLNKNIDNIPFKYKLVNKLF